MTTYKSALFMLVLPPNPKVVAIVGIILGSIVT